MSLAEQIGNLEADHSNALTQVASLTASNASLQAANTALLAENAALVAQNNALSAFTDDTRATVERLATDALDMLRASRRELFTPPAAAIPFAPPPRVTGKSALLAAPYVWSANETQAEAGLDHSEIAAITAEAEKSLAGLKGEEIAPVELTPAPTEPTIVEHADNGLPKFVQAPVGDGGTTTVLPANNISPRLVVAAAPLHTMAAASVPKDDTPLPEFLSRNVMFANRGETASA